MTNWCCFARPRSPNLSVPIQDEVFVNTRMFSGLISPWRQLIPFDAESSLVTLSTTTCGIFEASIFIVGLLARLFTSVTCEFSVLERPNDEDDLFELALTTGVMAEALLSRPRTVSEFRGIFRIHETARSAQHITHFFTIVVHMVQGIHQTI